MRPARALAELLRCHGIQRGYVGLDGKRHAAALPALLAVLRALGEDVATLDDVVAAARAAHGARARDRLAPVHVLWVGRPLVFDLTSPLADGDAAPALAVQLEGSPAGSAPVPLAVPDVDERRRFDADGTVYVVRRVTVRAELPPGYHTLVVSAGGATARAKLIAAPAHAPPLPRGFGLFAPLHAVRGGSAIGTFTDLAHLAAFTGRCGGTLFGTLPMLAASFGDPYEYSPYSPASRCFWNELHVDPAAVPEIAGGRPPAALTAGDLVDHARAMAWLRPLLESGCRELARRRDGRWRAFLAFVAGRPDVADFARFRAVQDARRAPWQTWPEPLRGGRIGDGDFDHENARYHEYVQWLAETQLADAAQHAREAGVRLYLDLPLGAHPSGYDAWRHRDLFVSGAAAGAPPDPFMVEGQDWGFQPLHPRRARARGHDHWIAVLRHHLRHAGALRIDHVMGLHRLFFVPHGMTPAHGVYVRYPADELYAVATLEATRAGAALVGEDLGVVPPVVRRRLARHDWLRMFVLQFAVRPDRSPPLESIPGEALASLNTHDMPTFAGWWQGSDVGEQRARGVLDDGSTAAALAGRERVKAALVQWLRAEGLLGGEADARSVLRAALRHLVRSPAHAVIVALEDLWGETRPQNVPGTWRERPNWRRRMTRDLAAITTDAELAEVVRGCARRDP